MAEAGSHSDVLAEAPARLPLLATKLHMPLTRPNFVARPRLLDILTQSFEYRLILLSAPAGFGKTTLLSEWLAASPCPAGWLSLDHGDNDPVRFWTYVIAALQEIRPGLGESALALLRTGSTSPMESILTLLINDLCSLDGRATLVLDDYHAIDNSAIHSAVAFLLDHLPVAMHLVISTRVDPPVPLAHLRADGRLLELRVDTLRFTRHETAEFLNQNLVLALSQVDIASLVDRTEGWIAGLQLAAMSLKGRTDASALIRALSSSHRYIMDYLVEEVLSLQPREIQIFLLQTCVLERFCGPLCDALMADGTSPPSVEAGAISPRSSASIVLTDPQTAERRIGPWPAPAQAILDYLDRANLFVVPLDDERMWYRYHHLFADLLRSRLLQMQGDARVRALHARASAWYEENGLLAEAIEHALAAHEGDRACRLIEQVAGNAWLSGEFYQVLHWIETLPVELTRSRPWLCVWYAWSRLQAGTVQDVEEQIDHAERVARTYVDQTPGLAQDEALAEQFSALRVTCAGLRQDTNKTIELAGRALERPRVNNGAASLMARSNVLNVLGFAYYVRGELPQAEHAYGRARRVAEQSGFLLRELLVVHKLALINQVMGRLHEPYQFYRQTLARLQQQGKGTFFAAGYLYCGLSHLLLEWNRFDEAQQMIGESLRLNELAQVPHLTIDICQAQARLFLAQGDVDAAQGALRKAGDLIEKHYCWPEVVSANECYQVRLWLATGDLRSAVRWTERGRPAGPKPLDFLHEVSEIARARVLLAQDAPGEAVGLLARLAETAQAGARTGRLVEILALQALGLSMILPVAQEYTGARPELKTLERSLALAEPEGYLRLFVDEGPAMCTLLRQAAASGIHPDYVQKLLEGFAVDPDADRAAVNALNRPFGPRRVTLSLVEPLTGREVEVLRLLAEGLSNREIAERLVLAIGTVKAHVHSICGKLDVQNRTQAILRAQQLGLLA